MQTRRHLDRSDMLPSPRKNEIKNQKKGDKTMKKTVAIKKEKAIEKKKIGKGWIDPTCTPMDL